MPLFSITSVLLFASLADNAFSELILDEAVHGLIREITQSYLVGSQCIVFVSEKTEPLNGVEVDGLPVMRITLGEKSRDTVLNIEENNTTDTFMLEESAQVFERILEKMLDARCLGHFVQISNAKAAVHSFFRALTRSIQRLQRFFVFLPSVKTKDMETFAEEMLSLKELELMQHVVIAKIHSNVPALVSLEKARQLRRLHCTDREVPGRTEDALLQGKKFIENLSLGFKDMRGNQAIATIQQNDTNDTVVAIELVTQSFIGHNPSEEVLLDLWMQFGSEGFFTLCTNLFPEKTVDLQGRSITATAIPYLPFVIMDHYADPPLHEGVEFLVYRELVKKLNGSTRVIYDPENLWGNIFEDGTGNGVVGNVLTGEADIGFAAFYLNWYNEWLWTEFSYPYCQSAAVLLVPRPKLLPGYFVPVLPFSPSMWVAVFVSILGISVSARCLSAALRRFLPGSTKDSISLSASLLDTLGMLVLQVPKERSHAPWKHFMTWLSVYFLLITSLYSGALASILTVPRYERPIDSLVDMATSDLSWMFPHVAVTWAFRDSEDPVLKTIADKYIEKSEEDLEVIAPKGEVGLHIEELSGGKRLMTGCSILVKQTLQGRLPNDGVYCYGAYITEEVVSKLRLMKEPLLEAQVVLIARKGGPYMDPLNQLILKLNQGGLGTYWQLDVVRHFLSSRLQLQISLSRTEDPDGSSPRTLQLFHVQGAFMLLGLGLFISALAFVAELAMNKAYPVEGY